MTRQILETKRLVDEVDDGTIVSKTWISIFAWCVRVILRMFRLIIHSIHYPTIGLIISVLTSGRSQFFCVHYRPLRPLLLVHDWRINA